MKILWCTLVLIWVAGWIKELVFVHAYMVGEGVDYPDNMVKYMVPLVLFFTWPYFYFYEKIR